MIKFLLSLISLILLLPLILFGCLAAFVYFNYLQLQPAEYNFLRDTGEIESIEYARFTFNDEGLQPNAVGVIPEEDHDAFISELKDIDCHTGITGEGFTSLADGLTIDGIIINYSDGAFEFITPYLCINSDFQPQTISDLINARVYGFDKEQFIELLNKYGAGISLDQVEDAVDQLPDPIPQN